MSVASVVCGITLIWNVIVNCAADTGCSFKIPKEPKTRIPLYLANNTGTCEYVIPQEGAIRFRQDQGIVFSCPGPRNVLEITQSNYTTGYCDSQSTVRIYGSTYDFNDVLCKKVIHGDVKATNRHCGGGRGNVIQIGYQITKKEWITLIEVCYNEVEGSTLYTQHYIFGNTVRDTANPRYRPDFSSDGIPKNLSITVVYRNVYQKSLFNYLLRNSEEAKKYINSKSFLARGHLSPLGDFIYHPWQFSSMFYLNVCPQWQAINTGNWKSVEMVVKRVAVRSNLVFKVITGTFEVLRLPDINNNLVDIYLTLEMRIPVPKYMWKIVYSAERKEGIVFVINNNPFVERFDGSECLCRSICDEYGWGTSSWNNASKGFVYCCDVRDFQKVVPSGPALSIKSVLSANCSS